MKCTLCGKTEGTGVQLNGLPENPELCRGCAIGLIKAVAQGIELPISIGDYKLKVSWVGPPPQGPSNNFNPAPSIGEGAEKWKSRDNF
ncbi:hypothetical protein HQ544_05510 [Candidatus Falkowbacteria bacterium]|nr:hypothetical protein [Candidatus Falkowbacteria bacterium]